MTWANASETSPTTRNSSRLNSNRDFWPTMTAMTHPLLQAIRSGRVLLMDGAMGTELQRAGLRQPDRAEQWNLARPEAVKAIHAAYVRSGADILLTNTFQANPLALSDRASHRPQRLEETYRAVLDFARSASKEDRFILIDIGPIVSKNNIEFQNPSVTDRVMQAVRQTSGASGVMIETCSSARVRYAVARARKLAHPVLLSLTYRHHSKRGFETFDGHSPEWFAERAAKWGVDALGVNCGLEITVADCAAILRRYRSATNLPLFARPNAGTPVKKGDRWLYPRSPKSMASKIPELLEAGATMIGGCCGTTPAHILAFRSVIDQWNARRTKANSRIPRSNSNSSK